MTLSLKKGILIEIPRIYMVCSIKNITKKRKYIK